MQREEQLPARLSAQLHGVDPPWSAREAAQLAQLYRGCLAVDASFALRPTVAYGGKPEFAVVATRPLPRGTRLPGLSGVLLACGEALTAEAARSMIQTKAHKQPVRLSGPISRVNHECRTPNVHMVPQSQPLLGFAQVALVTLSAIDAGEELCAHYSHTYFGPSNMDCLCAGCESEQVNGWLQGQGKQPLLAAPLAKTRATTGQRRRSGLEHTVYSYDEVGPLASPRVAGDYTRTLAALPSERCLVCRMLFVNLAPLTMCAGCREQAPLALLLPSPTVLQRYHAALCRQDDVPGLHHTSTPLGTLAKYLHQLELPGWRIAKRPVAYNAQQHKTLAVTAAAALGTQAGLDAAVGITCLCAAAEGGRQSGQVWFVLGEWRAANMAPFPRSRPCQYATVVVLKHQQVFIMDPCFTPSTSAAPIRLTVCASLHRVRALLTALTKGKRRVNTSGGLFLGAWRALDCESEYQLSWFACFEFLEAMRLGQVEEHASWAREQVTM